MNTFKTSNHLRPTKWIKRIFFTSLFGFLVYFKLLRYHDFTPTQITLSLSILLLLVISGQFDEIEITNNEIIFEQWSLIPFLKSKRRYNLNEIILVKKNSNYTHSDGDYTHLLLRARNAYEINFNNGQHEIIDNHTMGKELSSILKIIQKSKKQHPTSSSK